MVHKLEVISKDGKYSALLDGNVLEKIVYLPRDNLEMALARSNGDDFISTKVSTPLKDVPYCDVLYGITQMDEEVYTGGDEGLCTNSLEIKTENLTEGETLAITRIIGVLSYCVKVEKRSERKRREIETTLRHCLQTTLER